jgi:hypothetical protein
LLGAALFCATITAGVLGAADEPADRESLRSLDGIRVVVEDLPASAPSELRKEALRQAVESKLAAAHVPLQRPGEYPVGDPFLRVTITTTAESGGVAGYHVDLEFVQIVFLRRNPMLTFNLAKTWSAHARMGLVARGQLADRVQRDLADQVDQFIAAYKSVNSN